MQLKAGFKTDIGRKRSQNQDNGAIFPDAGLFIVADGMGGHRGGETASAMAVEIIANHLKDQTQSQDFSPRDAIRAAVKKASRDIFEKSMNVPELQGMGTTVVMLLVHNGTAFVGQVGDSRCYYFEPGVVWQLTRDHSLVQEKLRAGLITREQMRTDRMKNVITRSVGFEAHVEVDIYEMPIKAGGTYLLCSDGLSGLVDDLDIKKMIDSLVYTEKKDLSFAVDRLIDKANEGGGDDNVTVALIQIGDTHS
jgi:protein phosphatase